MGRGRAITSHVKDLNSAIGYYSNQNVERGAESRPFCLTREKLTGFLVSKGIVYKLSNLLENDAFFSKSG